jgi:hypothetical protein
MKDIHAVIEDPGKGLILIHCVWGVHSFGALPAMALMQFCGWSEDRAKAYWEKARNNAPCGGCDAWIEAKLKRCKVDPAFSITAAQRERVCPE